MKQPKRYQNKPTPMMPEDSEPDWYVLYGWCQRAKRKNRVKQLKRTIARLNREKEEAYNRLNREKEEAYHRGHQAGYDLGFSRYWF